MFQEIRAQVSFFLVFLGVIFPENLSAQNQALENQIKDIESKILSTLFVFR